MIAPAPTVARSELKANAVTVFIVPTFHFGGHAAASGPWAPQRRDEDLCSAGGGGGGSGCRSGEGAAAARAAPQRGRPASTAVAAWVWPASQWSVSPVA